MSYRVLLSLVVLAVLLSPAFACEPLDHDTGWFVTAKPPEALPEARFKDRNGNDVDFAGLRGSPLLVHFWGSWCPPCIAELPSIHRLQKMLWEEALRLVAVNRDRDGPPLLDALYREHETVNLPVFTDHWGQRAHRLGAKAVPITRYVDAAGREVGRYYGTAQWDSEVSQAHVRHCLRMPGRPG